MSRFKLATLPLALLAVLTTLLLQGGVVQATSTSHCKGWNIVSSPNAPGSYNILSSVTDVSVSDVWAVGDSFNTSTGVQSTLIEQWNGSGWSIINSPNIGTSDSLSGVAAASANEIWAVGEGSNSMQIPQTLIEKWDGTQWTIVNSPNVKGDQSTLSAVTVVSANDVWAVGSSFNPKTNILQTLTERWSGTKWSIVKSPDGSNPFNLLSGVTAVSTNDVWAVGDSYNPQTQVGQTLIEHWDGTQWSVVPDPNAGADDDLFGVAAASTNDIWAVGISSSGTAFQKTLIEHWDGTQWSIVKSPSLKQHDNLLNGAAVVSANDIWAVGVSSTRTPSVNQTLTEHWNGTKWSIVSSPNVQGLNDYLNGVAALSAHNIWTVGSAFDPNNHTSSQTLTEFRC